MVLVPTARAESVAVSTPADEIPAHRPYVECRTFEAATPVSSLRVPLALYVK